MNERRISRRTLLTRAALAGPAALTWTWGRAALACGDDAPPAKPLRFGVIADLHQDIMHDATRRVGAFVDAMNELGADFVLQLGDFCVPVPKNREFLARWREFDGPRYHVLGNHDFDGDGDVKPHGRYAFSRSETLEFWGMEKPYHSFDRGGIHFAVLDANEEKPGGNLPGYYRYVGEEQREWLRADLARTKLPSIVVSHQPLDGTDVVENAGEIRAIIEAGHAAEASGDVIACLSGHHHRDYVEEIRGIPYVQINSASYCWLGSKYARVRYGEDIDRRFPTIKYTAPYEEPVWAVFEVDVARRTVHVEGRASEFVGPAPWEISGTKESWRADRLRPAVSDRKLSW